MIGIMYKSGLTSCNRQRKYDKNADVTPSDGTPPAPKKAGRPKKRAIGFAKTKKKTVDQPANVESPHTPLPTKKKKTNPPPRRSTRATGRTLSSREKSPPQFFIAQPATPTKPLPVNNWASQKRVLNNRIATLKASSRIHRNLWMQSLAENARLNKTLLECDIPIDRAEWDSVPQLPSLPTSESISGFVKTALKSGDSHDINPGDLVRVFKALGLDRNGIMSDESSQEKLETGIKMLLDIHFVKKDVKARAECIAKALFINKNFGVDACNEVAFNITRSVTSCIFTSVALLKSMDLKTGSLNDCAISQYAQIEKESGLTNSNRVNSMLHHRGKISHVRNIANRFVKYLFDIKHNEDPLLREKYGDLVLFDKERLFRYLIENFGLMDKATAQGIIFALTGDGAEICGTSAASQTCIGLKMVDMACVDPETGAPLYYKNVEDSEGNMRLMYMGTQSTDACAVAGCVLRNETIEVVTECFGEFLHWCKSVEKNGLPAVGNKPAIMPCQLVGCGDMCFLQKMTGLGGACKVKKHFCLYCEVHGDQCMYLSKYGTDRCKLCIANEREKCCHRPVNGTTELNRKAERAMTLLTEDYKEHVGNQDSTMKDAVGPMPVACFSGWDGEEKAWQILNLQDTFSDDGSPTHPNLFDYIRPIKHTEEDSEIIKKTIMKLDTNALKKTDELHNIDFVMGKNARKDNMFIGNVTKDLIRRGYGRDKLPSSRVDKVSLLRKCLTIGAEMVMCRNALLLSEDASRTSWLCPGQCPPCILHANNRMVEKIVQQILLAGMRKNPSGQALSAFATRVEEAVNNEILKRTESRTRDMANWSFPFDKDNHGKLGDVTFNNKQAKKFAKGFKYLVAACTQDYDKKYQLGWAKTCEQYNVVAELLESKYHYKFEDVCAFQLEVDEFCENYFAKCGRDGMTNYIHLLHAGHMSHFLLEYGNLYRFSQQGWENVNGKLKRIFHHNTQKGGGRGGSSKLLPVMYTCARGLLWKHGHLDGLFQHLGEDGKIHIEYGKVKKMLRKSDVETSDIEHFANITFDFINPDDAMIDADDEEVLEGLNESYEIDIAADNEMYEVFGKEDAV